MVLWLWDFFNAVLTMPQLYRVEMPCQIYSIAANMRINSQIAFCHSTPIYTTTHNYTLATVRHFDSSWNHNAQPKTRRQGAWFCQHRFQTKGEKNKCCHSFSVSKSFSSTATLLPVQDVTLLSIAWKTLCGMIWLRVLSQSSGSI